MKTLGMAPDDKTEFIHKLKVRITAISGYAQLLERQIYESQHASERQLEYIAKLRRLINELTLEINEQSTDQRSQHEQETKSKDENGSPNAQGSECNCS